MVAALVVSLVLQVGGSILLAYEVRETHRRWHRKFRSPVTIQGHGMIPQPTLAVELDVSPLARDETLEQRLDRMEAQLGAARKHLTGEIRRVERSIAVEAEKAAHPVEQRIQPQVSDTIQYLAGLGERHKWTPWWLGPTLVLAGTILAGAASLVAEF
jgi:hypothetical protein